MNKNLANSSGNEDPIGAIPTKLTEVDQSFLEKCFTKFKAMESNHPHVAMATYTVLGSAAIYGGTQMGGVDAIGSLFSGEVFQNNSILDSFVFSGIPASAATWLTFAATQTKIWIPLVIVGSPSTLALGIPAVVAGAGVALIAGGTATLVHSTIAELIPPQFTLVDSLSALGLYTLAGACYVRALTLCKRLYGETLWNLITSVTQKLTDVFKVSLEHCGQILARAIQWIDTKTTEFVINALNKLMVLLNKGIDIMKAVLEVFEFRLQAQPINL